jgi:hypothetical protein
VALDHPVATRTRVLTLGGAEAAGFRGCERFAPRTRIHARTVVVERIGREGISYTLRLGPLAILACDEGPGGGRVRPCAVAIGKLFPDGLRDPRLTLACGFGRKKPLAFGWIVPVHDAAWIAVRASSGDELYRVATDLPVRIELTEGVSVADARATVVIRQLSATGRILRDETELMSVAG